MVSASFLMCRSQLEMPIRVLVSDAARPAKPSAISSADFFSRQILMISMKMINVSMPVRQQSQNTMIKPPLQAVRRPYGYARPSILYLSF